MYPLNKIKAHSMQLDSTITFFIQSVTFLKIKKLSSNLMLNDKVLMLIFLVFLIFVFILSFFLVWF